ncbi:stage V sporulation protein G [Paramaledivibacter caminithermalis DSM 15212]|jgi:stage V sporulation protein G|uniref:Putative septation protein SpoVG n=2 Tax=Paramaledivibacter TaxID=1884934 RepID=A0A1M6QMB6_PARC5|nr:stage V sporulation protein G [Paramaledivibacter caminithermalis DSM 15212]
MLVMIDVKGGNEMNITDVRIRKMNDEGKMKAIVSVTFDDSFVVHDIKIIEGQNGLFIAMPSRKVAEGDYRDIAHPINSSTRANLQEIILAEYEKAQVSIG